MSTKEVTHNVQDIARGVKKTFKQTVAVMEAFAWLGALVIVTLVVWHGLKNNDLVIDLPLWMVAAYSAPIVGLRMAWEFLSYLRKSGGEYER
jgi:hypothetical protein